MKVFITGGNGTLGRGVTARLLAAGHDVGVGTRSPTGRDDGAVEIAYSLEGGDDIATALRGVDTVVHLASDARHPDRDVVGTRALVDAAAAAEVGHVVYVSIVGIDHHPFGYYRAKLAAEEIVAAGDVEWTVVRSTQFHSLIGRYAEAVRRWPIAVAPAGVRVQPVDHEVVADAVATLVEAGPSGRAPDIAGAAVIEFRDAVRRYLAATGRRRRVARLPLTGGAIRAFRAGAVLAPGIDSGGRTFDEYLAERATTDGPGRTEVGAAR